MFRIASLLLASMASGTAATTSSKAYRIFSIPAHPKAGKASNSASSASEGSFVSTKSAKALDLSSSLSLSSKTAKSKSKDAKSAKVWCDPSASVSMSTILDGGNSTFSESLSMRSKAAKSKMAKCHPMSVSMSITTATPTYYPTYMPTDEPTHYPTHAPTSKPTHVPTAIPTGQPSTRRPTQRMVCQSGDFVDALGRDCFWYEDPNVELGCESLRDDSSDVDLTNGDGKTPWDECCYCGGGTMVPENTTSFFVDRRLEVLTESQDDGQQEMDVVSASASLKGTSVVCVSNRDFVDPLGRDCSFYVPENIEQGCDSLHGKGDLINEFPWMNAEGLTPWSECCFCGGGALEYGAALGEETAAY